MTRAALLAEIAAGVVFSGWDEAGVLAGVMGLQQVRDVTLIRHACIRLSHQGRGVGGALLTHLMTETTGPLLVGTWAAARWAIRFTSSMAFAWSATKKRPAAQHLLDHFAASAGDVGRSGSRRHRGIGRHGSPGLRGGDRPIRTDGMDHA